MLQSLSVFEPGVFVLCPLFSLLFSILLPKSVEDGDKIYPSSNSFVHPRHLELFDFIGRLLAKAVYEVSQCSALVIDLGSFSGYFSAHLTGQ